MIEVKFVINNNIMSKSSSKECISCLSEVPFDHTGIQCRQGHNMCVQCSGLWIDNLFSSTNFAKQFPPKCSVCNIEINLQIFERNITKEAQLSKFQSLSCSYFIKLNENEMWIECPYCDYREIRNTSNDPFMVYCQNEICKKITCFYCYKEITDSQLHKINEILLYSSSDDSDDSDDNTEDDNNHLNCWRYGNIKNKIEELIEKGACQECPSCKLRGQKDDSCLHMTCPECNQIWCYFCGLKVEDADKEDDGNNNIYSHNVDWSSNVKRCPMYFTQIADIDDDWPEQEEECMVKFHRFKTLGLLKKEFDKIGENEFKKLLKIFPQCIGGYTLDEIKEFDLEKPIFER